MFMNDNAFDDDIGSRKPSRKGSHREDVSNSVEILSLDDTPKRHGTKSSHSSHPNALKDEDDIDSIVDSNSEYISGSRSNVIQQQRDLQKKKLQERMQGGVVRTSAPKQYSAPRAMDIDDKPSRFGRDDDDDDEPPLRRGNSSRGNDNYGRRGSAEEDDDRRGSGGGRRQSNSSRDRDWDRGNSGRDGDRGSNSRDRSDRSEGRDRDRNGRSNDWDRERDRNGRSNDRDRPIRGDRDRNDRSDRDRDRDYDDRDPPRSSNSRGGGRGYKDDVPERRRTSNTKEMESESSKKSNARGLARDHDNDDEYERRGSAGRAKVSKPRSRSCSRSRSRSPSHSRSPSSDASSDDEHNDETAATTYDPSSNKPRTAPIKKPKLDMIDMKAFLMRPIPKAYDVVECYIERNKSGANKMFPEYSLFMKEGDRFLLTAKKRPKNRTSNYLISMQRGDLSRHGTDNFLGKLRANFLGTEFTMYDNGTSPKDADQHTITSNPGAIRQELGISMYSPNVLGHRGPRKMRVAVPRVREDGTRVVWRPLTKDDEMVNKCKEQDHTNLTYLINKPPRWNEQVCAYVLNFNGRVTMASVKNFQLVTPEDQETVVLQFGRVGKDLFTMDFRFPLCPFQAFAITLSSFDGKLACE